ncbi:hypothetical protein ACQEU5_25290 [Marinactinospora thermotolerans]|uniref:hypothetical protein n=1 Tax=Marinactinospora thermotolerans TaxID=531310 RepID=UPI003D93A9F1
MEMLIIAMVFAAVVKNGVVDTAAMATGKTPPSHAYRMAKLKAEQAMLQAAMDPSKVRTSPVDLRGGARMVLKHWYLDACEDVDHWRANRRKTRPERRAAKAERRRRRAETIRRWARRDDGIVDAEIVDEDTAFTPDPEPSVQEQPEQDRPRRTRTWRRTTTTEEVEVEEEGPEPEPQEPQVVYLPVPESQRPPLAHRRMVLISMLAGAGYEPDLEAISRMTGEEVDRAIEALVAHQQREREHA